MPTVYGCMKDRVKDGDSSIEVTEVTIHQISPLSDAVLVERTNQRSRVCLGRSKNQRSLDRGTQALIFGQVIPAVGRARLCLEHLRLLLCKISTFRDSNE